VRRVESSVCGCAAQHTQHPSDLSPTTGLSLADEWVQPHGTNGNLRPRDVISLAAWWARFDDDILVDLVEEALRANPNVLAAEATLRSARAILDVSQAGLFPPTSFGLSGLKSESLNPADFDRYESSFYASWELDIFGSNRSGVRAAKADVQTNAAELGDLRISLATETALTYVTLRSEPARLAIARENLTTQLETLQLTEWRVQAGLATSL